MIHIIILIIVSYYMIKSEKNYGYNLMVLDILNIIGISIQSIIVLIVQMLLVHKPTNIFIVNIMQSYKPIYKKIVIQRIQKKLGE